MRVTKRRIASIFAAAAISGGALFSSAAPSSAAVSGYCEGKAQYIASYHNLFWWYQTHVTVTRATPSKKSAGTIWANSLDAPWYYWADLWQETPGKTWANDLFLAPSPNWDAYINCEYGAHWSTND